MPEMVADVPQFLEELTDDLKKKGKATVDVKNHANGSSEMAGHFLQIAAKSASLEVDIKSNKTSAIALVKQDAEV